jgi:beta-fructofuranosidase
MDSQASSAMQALHAAALRVQDDLSRPAYHFCPPAQWMNDINGPLCHNGYYHIFYQHNPLTDMPMDERLAHMHWGHARSKDLVFWEHLPIALAPSSEKGEKSCWSGCAAIDGRGKPIIIYTAVFEDEIPFKKPFEQWLAVGDDELITWEKSPSNPLLTLRTHGGPEFNSDWRDPFLFKAAGKRFMIIGACGEAGVAVYEAQDDGLTMWKYRGRLLEESVECPNLFSMNDKWVFISSPFNLVKYSVGSLDLETMKFSPRIRGTVDWGHYYGTNVLIDDAGRRILFGWVPGWNWDLFQMGRGWNGCMALPRELKLGPGDRLLQSPIAELSRLRLQETSVHESDISMHDSTPIIKNAGGDTLEILLIFSHIEAAKVGLSLRSCTGEKTTLSFNNKESNLEVEDKKIPLSSHRPGQMSLRIFVDRSVLEVYANDGEAVITQMIHSNMTNPEVRVFVEGGSALLHSLDMWKLKSARAQNRY